MSFGFSCVILLSLDLVIGI